MFFTYRVKLLLKFFLFWLVAFSLNRLLFVGIFPWSVSGVTFEQLAKAFYLGLKFDARMAALFTLPQLVLAFFIFKHSHLIKKIMTWIFRFESLFFISGVFFDLGTFAYIKTRLNAGLLELLEHPLIAMRMMWETYPVLLVLPLYLLVFWLSGKLARKMIHQKDEAAHGNAWGSWATLLAVLSLSIYGTLTWYPLRWSEAFFSTHPYLSQVTLNPIHYFFDTMSFSSKQYDKNKVDQYYDVVADFLGVKDKNKEERKFLRNYPGKEGSERPNVVIIVLESTAGNKSSVLNNPLDPTPYLKKMADESVVFTRFFTPTESTARSIFATVTGNPDVSTGKSSSRNPFIVNQHSVMNEFKDYKKFYFLGGSASWGNIRGIFTNNVDGIEIYEEGKFESARNDVWGVSDLDLFIESHKVLDRTEKPFFAFIQSAGFHRPYTIPDKNLNFKIKTIAEAEARKWGFESSEEFNSLRFQDHAFGHFMELSKKSSYYKNTIFVVFGDHGLPTASSANLPPGYTSLFLTANHVPLVIHYPGRLAPQINRRVVSQVDVMPTIAGLAGIPYKTKTFGRDIFSLTPEDPEAAFIYVWHAKPYKIGWVTDKFYYVDHAGKESLHQYESEQPEKDLSKEFLLELKQGRDLSHAFWAFSQYFLYHNKKE